ncbi:MAG TPA: adenylate/guanylate cyclase domain-containing protein [Egibacteraceae bacterium]|nr:adenylate/guanylate cyclase domain-containing protein [Egibacteraceae bacterium]
MTQTLEPPANALEAGRRAHERHDWSEAFDRLREAEAAAPLDADDLVRLGEAAWWSGDLVSAIEARERAYALCVRQGDKARAAGLALNLVQDYASRVQHQQAGAFLARAERLLTDIPESAAHGFLTLTRARFALESGDMDDALRLAREGAALARRHDDPDTEALSLTIEGRVYIERGDIARGLQLLDEATTAAVTGELSPLATGIVYCSTIETCADLHDFHRAGEWTEKAQEWCKRHAGENGWPGVCRVHEAEVIAFRGDWQRAEDAARLAARELANFSVDAAGAAYYEVGEVRLRMGDLAEAEHAFRLADEHARDPQPGLALLRLAQGRPDAALAAIRRALEDPGRSPLWRAKLLPASVRIGLEAGDAGLARQSAEELERLAATYGTQSPVLGAQAACSRAAILLAEGQAAAAILRLREALRAWQQARAPYQAAETRARLATAYEAQQDLDAAITELEAALAAFEKLGAQPDAQQAAARLRALREQAGSHARTESRVRSFLFTDIEQSTALVEAIGDEAWTDLVRWHDQTLREVFAAHQGQEIDHAGDGFFVAFATADDALAAAVALQRRLADHRRDHGFAPKVRVGVHTAEAVSDAGGYRGKGVHAAARIAALAAGGEVVVSQDTLDAAGVPHPTSAPRETALPGISDAVRVATLDWMLLAD